jgi:hypothetical protein
VGNVDEVKDEMERACSAHGNEAEWIQGFGGNARMKGTTSKTHTYVGG